MDTVKVSFSLIPNVLWKCPSCGYVHEYQAMSSEKPEYVECVCGKIYHVEE